MPQADAPVSTGRTDSQGLGITEAHNPALAPLGAPAAPSLMENGARMGRGRPEDETHAALAALGGRLAAAVADKDLALAAHLMEEARRLAEMGVEEN
jgi:hypothetical protein